MSHGNSDRPSLEEQIQILTSQLQQAQKLTSLGELVSTTTHEFNNVLMTIINYAKMGLRHHDDATRDKAFDKILAASQRAARITNTILGMARNRTDTFEPTDLTQLIDDTLVLLEREMNKYRITVEKQFAPVPEAMVNGNQIQQVLLNLLINARQAMPRGGRILIKLDYDPTEDMLDLVVRDNGVGIPADKLPADLRSVLHHQERPRRQRQGRHRLGPVDLPQHHRSASRADSRGEHRRQRHRLHDPAARRQGQSAIDRHARARHSHTDPHGRSAADFVGSAMAAASSLDDDAQASAQVGQHALFQHGVPAHRNPADVSAVRPAVHCPAAVASRRDAALRR